MSIITKMFLGKGQAEILAEDKVQKKLESSSQVTLNLTLQFEMRIFKSVFPNHFLMYCVVSIRRRKRACGRGEGRTKGGCR
jgi:hypothetical protein